MKSIIKKTFHLFGLNISRLNPPKEEKAYVPKVEDPIEFNSKANLELLYKNEKNLKDNNFSEPRINFSRNILRQAQLNGVNYEGKSVADVGCGTGHLLKLISDSYKPAQITGYEYSEEALKVAGRVTPSANFLLHDIYEPFQEKYDVVFCIEVLEHLLYPWKALENLTSMLLSKGTLVITIPDGRIDCWDGHINFWSPESWNAFLEFHLSSKEYTISSFSVQRVNLMAVIKRIN